MRHVCPECGDTGDAGTCATDNVSRVPAGADALLGMQIGSWRLARLIGAGGMGRVYLGVQPAIGARVAIKVLKDAADTDLVDRFFNEARAVNLIRHEGIVDVIDLGRLPDGSPYIVMEYLEGAPLRAFVKLASPAGAVARVIADVLAALEAAHAKAIVHRDLKPDNIFISPGGRATVLDFGIAKLVRDLTTTQSGSLLGTPAYMSPEQARSQPVDARSDLYSIGVILYEATTGRLPFEAPSLYELLDQHVKVAPKPPREIEPAIPRALEDVILRALAKDPADRFASASEMRTALLAAIEDLPPAELELPAVAPRFSIPPSDRNAATQASVAFAETQASEPGRGSTPKVDAAPTDDDGGSIRLSRALLVVMVGTALAGIGAIAYMVFREHEPPPLALPTGADGALAIPSADGALAIDGALATAPSDAVVATAAPTTAPSDAALATAPSDAAVARDAGAIVTRAAPKPEPPPDFSKGGVPLVIKNPTKFDPHAFYKTALARAKWAAQGPVRPSKLTWRNFDRDGTIDITAGGVAEYHFAMLEPKTDYCYVFLFVETKEPRINIGRVDKGGPCTGAIAPPRCTLAQLWARAAEKGLPDTVQRATVNKWGRSWVFSSTEHDKSFDILDDCP